MFTDFVFVGIYSKTFLIFEHFFHFFKLGGGRRGQTQTPNLFAVWGGLLPPPQTQNPSLLLLSMKQVSAAACNYSDNLHSIEKYKGEISL